jgi:hypothetical protein
MQRLAPGGPSRSVQTKTELRFSEEFIEGRIVGPTELSTLVRHTFRFAGYSGVIRELKRTASAQSGRLKCIHNEDFRVCLSVLEINSRAINGMYRFACVRRNGRRAY